MKTLFVDCPTGLAGDMLMAAFLDLGVPKEEIVAPLRQLGLANTFELKIEESNTFSLRGIRVSVDRLESSPPLRRWQDIKKLINGAPWPDSLRRKVSGVFQSLAEAESVVHGCDIDNVHFHEIGAIDSLVDVVTVCAAIEYLNPSQIVCAIPPIGRGTVKTSHGLLPVPAPAVLEIAKEHHIELVGGEGQPNGELTTPTGLALMAVLANKFGQLSSFRVRQVGVGLGHRRLDRPNLLRIYLIDKHIEKASFDSLYSPKWQPLISQEIWIDDSTSEDIALLVDELRLSGAFDVICQSVLMKKGRQGFRIEALVTPEKAPSLRLVWLKNGTTIGLRERSDGRWVLPRRRGFCMTHLGKIFVKQVYRPDGRLSVKPEHDELVRISRETNKTIEEVRHIVSLAFEDFVPNEEWSW